MKSEKLIRLLSLEKGKELLEKSKQMDKIIVTEDQYNSFFENINVEIHDFNITPILQQGVFCAETDRIQDFIIFSCEINNDVSLLLRCDSFQVKDDVSLWNYSATINIGVGEDSFLLTATEYTDAKVVIYEKQGLISCKEAYIENIIQKKTANISAFCKTMAWINYIGKNPEYKTVSYKQRHKKALLQESAKIPVKTKSVMEHVVKINGVRIITENKQLASKLQRKTPQRHTDFWSVRGHYRHYKNGRIIYIKSYSKGKQTQTSKPKIYKF